MRYLPFASLLLLSVGLPFAASAQSSPFDTIVGDAERVEGFIPYYYVEDKDQLLLSVPANLGDFIYINSLAAGVGSNDIGLDRGQLGDTRLVRFRKTGNKLLLEQPNQDYRATSDNAAERASVAEAFASSILAGLPILSTDRGSNAESSEDDRYLIDLTPMLLQDAHGVAQRLDDSGQGSFKVDPDRSALYLERTKNFPKNSEFEALITLAGSATGGELRSVTPTPDAVTTRQHHSFVALPELGYQPRRFDPRAGYNMLAYADYATPIGEPLVQRFIVRHRLEAASGLGGAAVAPIVYYLDPGAPEPVRSALIEGASWWDEAFQAAGYAPGTFRVEVLPEGADPLDVRYNVIQWVHRSTRGWSYGASVVDPRTGEIIKGHVSLGSLRVRQDYLIAQGLIDAYDATGAADPRLLEFALARLRQLSAHEVGHTIGLAHNFAASTADRSSVMDYPHPLANLSADGSEVDLSAAYATGIGDWDKQTIKYGYTSFAEADETDGLAAVLAENEQLGLPFISDRDAREVSGAHPGAHLWDNGQDAAAEWTRITKLRARTLSQLDLSNLAPGRPIAELENVLAPVYLAHRYQVEAAAKLVGGVEYAYSVKGSDAAEPVQPVAKAEQQAALDALLVTLTPEFLALPASLLKLLPPQPLGYRRNRELFGSYSGPTFDPEAAAEASVDHTLRYLLDPARIARLRLQHSTGEGLDPGVLAKALKEAAGSGTNLKSQMLAEVVAARTVEHALQLAAAEEASGSTRAWGLQLSRDVADGGKSPALAQYLQSRVATFLADPTAFTPQAGARIPDGSPIGCGE